MRALVGSLMALWARAGKGVVRSHATRRAVGQCPLVADVALALAPPIALTLPSIATVYSTPE